MAKKRKNNAYPYAKIIIGVLCLLIAAALYIIDAASDDKLEPVDGELEAHFIDVGQGDSELIITKDAVILIDCGTRDSADTLVAYLAQYCTDIDYLILTHPHEDHIGGAPKVLERFNVKNVIMTDDTSTSKIFSNLLTALESSDAVVHEAKAGDTYTAGAVRMKLLGPSVDTDDLNNRSIIVRVDFGNTSFMYTGDAEELAESASLGSFASSEFKANVLKVGHHGSSTSTSESFLKAVSPSIAVISCGNGNSYGHPHRETMRLLEQSGITIYRTDELGSVVLVSDGDSVKRK